MNFSAGDPLADLLGDNSDKNVKAPTTPRKVTESLVLVPGSGADNTPFKYRSRHANQRIVQREHPTDGEESDLGFDPKEAKTKTKRNLYFGDILGETTKERPSTAVSASRQRAAEPAQPKTSGSSSALWLDGDSAAPKATEPQPVVVDAAGPPQLFDKLNLNATTALATLQQQESQLTIATRMKAQERALLEIGQKQSSLLKQQEQQFEQLVRDQMQRQQVLETSLQEQQARINAQIRMLMTQPAEYAVPAMATTQPTADLEATEGHKHEALSLACDVKRLELEKQRCEELIANTKANYEQEIELIERSYKKQISVLEQQMTSVEARWHSEHDEMRRHYGEQLQELNEHLKTRKVTHDEELSTLRQAHEAELRQLRQSHAESLTLLREEHRQMLDMLRQSKLLEFSALQENGNYLETMRLATDNLGALSSGLEDLRDQMTGKLETLNAERAQKLEAREQRLADSERRLALETERNADEKQRLIELVGSLEARLSQLHKDTDEESWTLRQKLASLEAEKSAFEREKEYQREQQTREEARLDELKQRQQQESARLTADLQTERQQLAMERAKLDMERKLSLRNDVGQQRQLEAEAQLSVANECMRRADEERERYHALVRELAERKRVLDDKEQTLTSREQQLMAEARTLRLERERTQLAERRAQQQAADLQTKLQLLSKRMSELCAKEEMLSQEQMLLAKDRLAVQHERSASKCTLCRAATVKADAGQRLGMRRPYSVIKNMLTSDDTTNIVDRMLDERIANSFQRMRCNSSVTGDRWALSASALDDDSKSMVLDHVNGDQFDAINEELELSGSNADS